MKLTAFIIGVVGCHASDLNHGTEFSFAYEFTLKRYLSRGYRFGRDRYMIPTILLI